MPGVSFSSVNRTRSTSSVSEPGTARTEDQVTRNVSDKLGASAQKRDAFLKFVKIIQKQSNLPQAALLKDQLADAYVLKKIKYALAKITGIDLKDIGTIIERTKENKLFTGSFYSTSIRTLLDNLGFNSHDIMDVSGISVYLPGHFLSGLNLSHLNLSELDLSDLNLNDIILEGADLSGADLENAELNFAHLKGAILNGANLRGVKFSWAVLDDADLRGAKLEDAIWNRTSSKGARLDLHVVIPPPF